MKIFCFDTETTDKAEFKLALNHPAQPNLVQLGGILFDDRGGHELAVINVLNKDCGEIAPGALETHGITQESAEAYGIPAPLVLALFNQLVLQADRVVCHNSGFDVRVMRTMALRLAKTDRTLEKDLFCTMLATTPICKIAKPKRYNKYGDDPYKWPTLAEAHKHFTGERCQDAHDALADVRATKTVYMALPPEAKAAANFTL